MELTNFNWPLALAGFLGIFLHIVMKAQETTGQTLEALWLYVRLNTLNVIMAVGCYMAIIIVWQVDGIDFMGLYQAKLTGMTVILGYVSISIFKTAVGIRTKIKDDKLWTEPPAENADPGTDPSAKGPTP